MSIFNKNLNGELKSLIFWRDGYFYKDGWMGNKDMNVIIEDIWMGNSVEIVEYNNRLNSIMIELL